MKSKAKRHATSRGRVPQQERSRFTVEAILTAAKTLVVRHGCDALTTNGVARLAGVSIGSLYQYFPSKRAILIELRRRHQEQGEQIFRAELARLIGQPLPVVTRRFVEKMLEVHRTDPALHRALESHGRTSGYGEWERRAVQLARFYFEHHRDELVVDNLDQAAFVALVATEAITHATVLERPEFLDDEALIDGVVRMLLGYLTGSAHDRASNPGTATA